MRSTDTRQRPIVAVMMMLFLGLVPGFLASARAESWPDRPVRIIVAYAPGGGTDIIARVIAQKLGETFGQRFFVENKPGASGMTAARDVGHGDPAAYPFLV